MGRRITAVGAEWLRRRRKVPTMSQVLSSIPPYSTFGSERSQVRTWGRQTCFLPRTPSNHLTPLDTVVQLLDAHVFARGYCLIGSSSLYHFLLTRPVKQSSISAAKSDILASNALRETAFATNARRKDIFPVFVCLSLKTRRQQLVWRANRHPCLPLRQWTPTMTR